MGNQKSINMEKEEDFFLMGVARISSQQKAAPLLCLNIIIPGLGTFISAFMDQGGVNTRSLGYAFLQCLLTFTFLLGWYWSIYHGFLMYTHAGLNHTYRYNNSNQLEEPSMPA